MGTGMDKSDGLVGEQFSDLLIGISLLSRLHCETSLRMTYTGIFYTDWSGTDDNHLSSLGNISLHRLELGPSLLERVGRIPSHGVWLSSTDSKYAFLLSALLYGA